MAARTAQTGLRVTPREAAVQDDKYFEEWERLYERLVAALSRYGTEECTGRGDFWVVDESNGYRQHKVYFNALRLLDPGIVGELQRMLSNFLDSKIFVAVYVLLHIPHNDCIRSV